MQPLGIHIALDGPSIRIAREHFGYGMSPVHAQALEWQAEQLVPIRGARAARVIRHRSGWVELAKSGQQIREHGNDKLSVRGCIDLTSGGIEQRDAVGAGRRLQLHIGRQQVEQLPIEGRVGAIGQAAHGLSGVLMRTGCRINIKSERATDEADQRLVAAQTRARQFHGVGLELQPFG